MKRLIFSGFTILLANIGFSQSVTFAYSGSAQTYTVPACVTSITVDVRGGQGGSVSNLTIAPTAAAGGKGGRVQATIPVVGGTILQVNVGGVGQSDALTLSCQTSTGGFNGGAIGYGGYNSYNYNDGGGGGASDIRTPPYAYANVLVVAGGGGGSACTGCLGSAVAGGVGGGLTGGNGAGGACATGTDFGQGGTQLAGGAGGTFWGAAAAGTSAVGGASLACCAVTCGGGGGGGGGYYGGGGGSLAAGGGGSSYTIATATAVTHTQGFQASNGIIIITPNCALPIQLLSFDAVYVKSIGSVSINWSTATETNNKLFTVQKSADGNNWSVVTTMPGAGNSNKTLNYSATDETPYDGISYYRLMQIDYDGAITYSQTVPVNIVANYTVNLFPNPTKGNITLSYTTQSSDPVNIIITDVSGRIISQFNKDNIQVGINDFQIQSSNWSKGMYFIMLSNTEKAFYLKFIKE